ncbi:MAG: hypothetical protein HY904_24235 [Deltaproteobacteria bacterium]|nr:hypothetical protein [Deltaproteobacteria bacterium]
MGGSRGVAGLWRFWVALLLMLGGAPGARAATADVAIVLVDAAGLDPKMAETLLDSFQVSFARASMLNTVSQSDLAATVGFEKQKQLVGCESGSCLAELGGALGVRHLITTRFAKVGSAFLILVKLVDVTAGGVPVAADQETVPGKDERKLLEAVQRLATRFGRAVGIQLGRVSNWPTAEGQPPPPAADPAAAAPAEEPAAHLEPAGHGSKASDDEDEDDEDQPKKKKTKAKKAPKKKSADDDGQTPSAGRRFGWIASAAANGVAACGTALGCLGGVVGLPVGMLIGGAASNNNGYAALAGMFCCSAPCFAVGCGSLVSLLIGGGVTGALFFLRGGGGGGGGDVEDDPPARKKKGASAAADDDEEEDE